MITDLAEVLRRGTEKAEENLAFRRYLSAHHVPEAAFQNIASEIQREIDCTACANCCRESVVTVTAREIEIIAEYLDIPAEAAKRLYTDPDPDAPVLRKLRSTPDGCIFLDGNLCMIYEARPRACHDFPHIGVGSHSLGARPASHARWAALCPIIYNALETYKHRTGYHPHK